MRLDLEHISYSTHKQEGAVLLRQWSQLDPLEPICELINSVYSKAEVKIWRPNKKRITRNEFVLKQKKVQTLLAYVGKALAGTIYLTIQGNMLRFELLAVSPYFRGRGIGSLLVTEVEKISSELKVVGIKFELLVPVSWQHLDKERVINWYKNRSYKVFGRQSIWALCPDDVKFLMAPAEFLLWEKSLLSTASKNINSEN